MQGKYGEAEPLFNEALPVLNKAGRFSFPW